MSDTEWVPIIRAEIEAALASAGLNHSSAARELAVPLRTWRNWMDKYEAIPAARYPIVALLLRLPEPPEGVNVARTPWLILREIEDVVSRLGLVEDQMRQLRDQLGPPQRD